MRFMSAHNDRLCVATYGEDVSWVPATGYDASIYDATGQRPGLIPVANEAREASQYLRHIIAHYGDFRPYEIFLQGEPLAHSPSLMSMLRHRPWRCVPAMPLGLRCIGHASPPRRHYRAAQAFAQDLGIEFPAGRDWHIGAQFAASREALMARPLAWWRRVLAKCIIEREISPWAIERLWMEILSAPPKR